MIIVRSERRLPPAKGISEYRRIGVARTRESNRLASLFMVPLMVRPRSLSQPEELRIMIMMPGGALKL